MYDNDSFHPYLKAYPEHIALVPDGGRRWAKRTGCTNQQAYAISMNFITRIIEHVFSRGARYFSVYFSSTSNFRRTGAEVHDFSVVEWDYIRNTFLPYALENQIRIRIAGTYNENLAPFAEAIRQVETQTAAGKKTVYFCFNYSSLDEIDMAAREACRQGGSFVNYLQIPHPVDILIRTGKANTLSGFLLPQIACARIFFVDKLFNDFTMEELEDIIDSYLGFELKYGE